MNPRVLIVDDHPLVTEALTLAVQQASPASQVDTACDLAAACLMAASSTRYDLVLLDLSLPDSEGLSGLLTLQARMSETRIAIVTSRASADTVRSAEELGAVGYVLKSTSFAQLTEDCRALLAGERRFPALQPDRPAWDDEDARARLSELSGAQRKIFFALQDGRANKQIAYDLDLAEATIKAHLTAVFRKLKVTNRSQAIVLARRLSGDH
jgi:DNA-binding NarL/FixJ family response regulator